MPLWRIFSHPDTFSLEQRAALARDITALYGFLQAFYVNVIFINSGENDIWIGGKPKTNFVRIVIEQIARTLPDDATEGGKMRRKGWMDRINEVCPILTLFRNVATEVPSSGRGEQTTKNDRSTAYQVLLLQLVMNG